MSRKLIITLLLFTIGYTSMYAQNGTSFSLQNAIDYAKRNNRQIKNADKSILAARYQQWETTTMGLPQISGKVEYRNWIEQQKQLLPATFVNPNAPEGTFAEVAFGTTQSLGANATLSQLLFDGQYLVGLQASKVFLDITNLAKEKTETEIEKSVVNAYGNVLMAKELVDITESNIKNVKKSLYETEKMYENGLVEEENVEQLKITKLTLDNAKANAERLLNLGYNMLNVLMGNSIDDKIYASDDLENLSTSNITLTKKTKQYSLANNLDVKIAENDLKSQLLLKKQQQSKGLPTLAAFLNAGYNGNANSFTFHKKEQKWLGFALVGINLDIPIFSSLGRTKAVQRMQIEIDKKENDLEDIRNQTKLKLDRANSDYTFSLQNLKTTKQSLKLAERIEKKNQVKFKEGVGSSFELSQAQQQLYSSQRNYIEAMVNVINAKAEIKSIINE